MVVKKFQLSKKIPYPKSIYFLISNVFCERFSYYGIRTILVLYFRNKLYYSDDTSTVIFHVFSMFSYLFGLFGAMLADSVLGKFRTIFYVSIVYAIGQLLLSASATPWLSWRAGEFAMVGLTLIALGNGGIEPCVSAFGGDQFVLPEQECYLANFFPLYFFVINIATLISTSTLPIVRNDVACFGESTCYSLGFFLSAAFMILSIVILAAGKSLYRIKAPEENVVLRVIKCIWHAIGNKIRTRRGRERDHWLDYADDAYDSTLIADIRSTLSVLKLFLPLPIFWALISQQGSRWLIQAIRMDGQIGSFFLKPDQMLMANPILVLALIPIFGSCLNPILAKMRLVRTPLQRLGAGGILAGLAFVISGVVELELEKTYAVVPSEGLAQVRIFNALNCSIPMTVGDESFVLDSLSVWENKHVAATGNVTLNYTANFARCNAQGATGRLRGHTEGTINATESMALSWVVTSDGLGHDYVDSVTKTTSGDPAVRALIYLEGSANSSATLSFFTKSQSSLLLDVDSSFARTDQMELEPGIYDVYLNETLVQSSVEFKLGGVYVLTTYANAMGDAVANTITITSPNSMHVLWLLPQFIVITSAEVMFCITGLEFAFTQAPVTMKSLLMACWLLTVAIGDLIVVVITEIFTFDSQASQFFLFAGLEWACILIFSLMAISYKYVDLNDNEPAANISNTERNCGSVNDAFRCDDET